MASFGFGGSGFGSANTNPNSGFGASGFGNSTTNTGFGGSTSTGFGQPAAGSSLFGASTNAGGGFGGFGSNNTTNATSSPFGATNKPAFGSAAPATGGGLFGGGATSTPANTGFGSGGGFGNTANTFGSANAGGNNLFGAAKPTTTGFGAGGTGGTMFGGAANSQPSTGFGGAASSAFGNATAQPTNNGTGSTPFSAFIEKDNASSANSHYQSITFMQPYQAFSFEELRLADYTAGRKFGNANGQAGAFGQSTGFGGGFGANNNQQPAQTNTGGVFGASTSNNTGGGLFGAQSSTPFGAAANANTNTGFGGGSGLFGQQNKPAAGGLFGSTPASTGTTGGGLFGTANNNTTNTSTGFGGFGNNNQQPAQANTGGLFGSANNTQNKPAFGGFGSTPAATSTGAFGQAANANSTGGSGIFGQSTTNTASPFGGAQQNNAPANNSGGLFGGGGNAFGQNNQNQQQQNQTGTTGGLFSGGGSSAFGQNNQQKPNPFGGASTGTSGGLFGGAQPQQNNAGGGLFGQTNNNNQAQSGGLFGAPKPASGGGLFGGAQPQQNTGGGLFGGGQAQQNTGGGLFGGQANQQKPAGGLFGNTNNQPATGGSSLFGGNQNQQQNAGGSLFGGSTQQSGQSNSLFSQSNQQQSSFAATLLTNPYGNDQLFSNLGNPAPAVGPIATPLSGAQKPAKRPAALPQFKINPSASLRLITPQKRSNGYGFSYATYGTPGSAQSFTSNGLGSSLLQSGGLSRSLGKSFSTSNLNKSVGSGDSVLAPGAFTPNSRSYTGGSIRRLKIDRNLRTDLFGDNNSVEPPTKRVSFDDGDKGKTSTNGYVETPASSALVRTETDGPEPSSEDLGYSRAERPTTNGASTNGTPSANPVRGNELAMVPEDGPAPPSSQTKPVSAKDLPRSQADAQIGDYWMTPSMDDLRNMSRAQLKSVSGFTVGRHGVGKIEFDPVDLSQVPLDDIVDGIVKLNVRQATVYTSGVNTPPMGQGLNVPSTITLENSWPRAQGGRLPVHERKGNRYDKHIERLRRVEDTEFISYDPETGIWVFRVPHFTTYGLDDDDESEDEAEYGSDMMNTSQDPTPKGNNTAVQEMSQVSSEEGSVISDEDDESNPDDTFDFKKGPSNILPGSFGAQPIHNDDEMADDNDAQDQEEDSSYLEQQGAQSLEDPFRSSGSSNAPPVEAVDEQMEEEEVDHEEMSEQDMAGSFPRPAPAASASYNDYGISFSGSLMPKSILKASTMLNGTPKKDLALAGDWAEQLQRTASPKKQDRQALRERQSVMGALPVDTAPPLAASIAGKAFSTTMDIMNSLWAPSASTAGHGLQTSTVGGKGFEWPYQKQSRTEDAFADMNETERGFHTSFKPRWATDGTLVYISNSTAPSPSGNMFRSKKPIVSEHTDVRFAQFSSPQDSLTTSLQLQLQQSPITSAETSFAAIAESLAHSETREAQHERAVWRLASILFDSIEIGCADSIKNIPTARVAELESRIRRDALSGFWAQLVHAEVAQHAKDASTAEERAIAFLSGNSIEDACSALLEGRDFRLATIVAQLPGNAKSKEMMAKQIESWRSQNMVSEMTESVRALYELVAGNTCISEGKSGAAEDRASAFGISSRFGLDWRRSFGLRLWFSGANESLADAVQLYIDDVASGKETVRPVPYFTEQSLAPSWNDANAQGNEDTLLGLLKLYSRQPSSGVGDVRSLITNLFSPASVSGSPLNARLSWQMATLLQKKGILTAAELSDASLDQLSLTLSSQLEAANELVFATNVLLHLTNKSARERHIRDLLYRRASALYDAGNPDALPTVLTQDFGLPEQWLWHARALYARSMLDDHNAEVTYLLRAGDSTQAHSVLCRSVGPTAIIERDYDGLRELLGLFHDMLPAGTIENWRTGGQVYFDYIHLLDLVHRDDDASRASKKELLDRLTTALPGVLEGRAGKVDLEERVAIGEMAGLVKAEVEKMGREEKGMDRNLINRLPVAGGKYAKQGVDLSRAYYRAIVA